MNIIADTNLLVRAATNDDESQNRIAAAELAAADLIAVTGPSLCELVWVMSQSYKMSRPRIAQSIRDLIDTANVLVDRPAVEAGLALLDAGGDFADGLIAYEGSLLGGHIFVSFDKRAVRLITAQGGLARLAS